MGGVLFVKADPGVSVICFRVRAGGVEHAFDRVRSAGDVGSAFDACECRGDQHEQEANDADDDEQFEQRESAGALTLLLSGEAVTALTGGNSHGPLTFFYGKTSP